MVRLGRRPSAPNGLTRNKTKWTIRWQRIANRDAKGDWATPLAKRLLRKALEQLAHGKCAFCEGRPKATGDIEIDQDFHFGPGTVKVYTRAAPKTTSFRAEPCTSPPAAGPKARPSAHRR